jgi:hypothetical protein
LIESLQVGGNVFNRFLVPSNSCSYQVSRAKGEESEEQASSSSLKGGNSSGSPKSVHYPPAKVSIFEERGAPSHSLHRPQTTADESPDNKLLEENKKLRVELRKIRQENMQMKEDGVRQRIQLAGNSPASSSGAATKSSDLLAQQKLMGHDVSLAGGQQEIVQLLVNPNVLAIALLFLVVGVVIGKILF